MDKLVAYLFDVLKEHPVGATLLFITSLIGITFAVLLYLKTTPGASEILRTPIFLIISATSIGIGIGYVVYTNIDFSPKFRIDLLFDETITQDRSIIGKLTSIIQTKHFRLKFIDKVVKSSKDYHYLTFNEANSSINSSVRDKSLSTHTILITNKSLSDDSNWHNLFYSVRGRVGVISLFGITDLTDRTKNDLILRYLATLIPIVVMHASTSKDLLPDASPDVIQGCLYDFSKDRKMFIDKLQTNLSPCDAESEGIQKAFGDDILEEVKTILQKISKDSV